MTDHTPGPWNIGSTEKGECRTVYGDKWRGLPGHQCAPTIAEVGSVFASEFEDGEITANVHLISAAPDLLEALIDAVKIIREHVPEDALGMDSTGDLTETHLTYSWPILEEHLSDMDEAIAKAKPAP